MDLWDKLLEDYDEIVCIPMSSGLSSTCETALSLAQDYDEKVQVVNNQRISVTQEQSVYDAIKLRDEGKSAAEIRQVLEKEKMQASIYITVDTLKYLKKGGRITPAAAAIGTVLNLKPVLQIRGEKLDAFAKVRGWKAAKKTMLNAIEKDLTDRFADVKDQMVLGMAYTCSKEEADEWKNEIQTRFPDYELVEGLLSLSSCCIAVQGPLYLSPLTTCNRNVETLVQRHSCLRSLTSWAKCLRNAPCQCTAHATARADIGFFKSECFSRTGTFLSTNTKFQIRSRKPDGYRPG